ncbi:[Wnt protein] O-palmitoleoyl-L-serine hydrolase [Salvia divinorum]|uniref:Pectin acetylesterase n=1 Tax=Salvia divinorum TaxID=28513 RepID=A0ABD1G943_SALDI
MGKSVMMITILFLCALEDICQDPVNFTLLHSAVPKGAVCLDGTPPAYAYSEGFGDGSTNWIIFLEGGGWCALEGDGLENCQERSKSYYYYGSTDKKYFVQGYNFTGILTSDSQINPNFYNWHKVYVHYCDGSMNGKCPKCYLDGLLSSKCISDSGFFIREEGELARQSGWHFAQVIATHELGALLPRSCTRKRDPNLCLFAEYLVEDVATPLFLVESTFDIYQIEYNLKLTAPDLNWDNCLSHLGTVQCYRNRNLERFWTYF